MKYKFIFLFILFVCFFTSCKKENRCDCIKRTGDIVTELRIVKTFDKIFVEDNINVFITQDTFEEVKVEAGEHIVPLIETEVIDGTIYLRNKNRCNWTRTYKAPINVHIRIPNMHYITSDGTGDVKSVNTITSDTFEIETKNSGSIDLTVNNFKLATHMHGSGDLTLHGTTESCYSSIGGTAYLYCKDLQAGYIYLHTFTIGNCYVNTSGMLDCKIDSKGDVHCYGHPVIVNKVLLGAGQVFIE